MKLRAASGAGNIVATAKVLAGSARVLGAKKALRQWFYSKKGRGGLGNDQV